MLKAVKYIFIILSLILIAAHFLRAGIPSLAFLFTFLSVFLFIKHPISTLIIRIAILSGIAAYIGTAFKIISLRKQLGLPYQKAAFIMAGVIGFITISFILTFKKEKQQQP
ncbi:hypothetical protein SAMN06265340_11327 [Desulfurobacterium atlanticum]|uniref:Uncharacterized protein n=2 Tax=Desulfurobacterium atlanticum TaxID=240169 RepID=A0A238ZXQ9_9BACT|nr:hypothetical protein SAMN06265340_11327 [Desulfurobacterium atlanticum]